MHNFSKVVRWIAAVCVCFAIYFDYFSNSLGSNVHVRVALNYFVLFTTIKMVYTSINWIAHISAGFYSINATWTSMSFRWSWNEMKWNEMNAHRNYSNSNHQSVKNTVYCLINTDSVRYLLIFDHWYSILVIHTEV